MRRINSQVEIEPLVVDVDHSKTSQSLCADVDCYSPLDGTDNFETRFLINDAAVKLGIPWVYGGCLGAESQTMTILPGETPVLSLRHGRAPPDAAPRRPATCPGFLRESSA